MSCTELARQAGLSVSAVHQRVRRLEQDGGIKGYGAVFDPDVVGLALPALVSIRAFDAAWPSGPARARPSYTKAPGTPPRPTPCRSGSSPWRRSRRAIASRATRTTS